jgi:hypothetical protein
VEPRTGNTGFSPKTWGKKPETTLSTRNLEGSVDLRDGFAAAVWVGSSTR